MDIIELLKDESKTISELVPLLNKSSATISRMRKKYGIKIKRGSKKGKLKPERVKPLVSRSCIQCNKLFLVKPCYTKKYCSQSCAGKSIDKSYMQTEEYRNAMRKDTTPAYKRYAGLVHRLSQKNYEENIMIINPNGYVRTRCGVDNGWQLDHIIPIKECFEKGISVEEASSVNNLRMLPWKHNLMRNYVHNL